ncbi:MAG: hypothetical protein H6831_08150 [Planctomycetes bacterium]|nr:hypothetical protein [Planctomycetota bacterium]MCB9904363.1 hypothetical protein [Planctomycetota bacterium]
MNTPLDWKAATDTAARHLADVLRHAFDHREEHAAIVVFDTQCELACALTEAYRRSLPDATFMDFDRVRKPTILAGFDILQPGDLVVLVQSTSFRLDAFRIRVELFRRGLKVIEHPHLSRMPGGEGLVYVDALAYDPAYLRGVGRALKERLDRASACVVESGGERLCFDAGFEDAKLNVGDYVGMQNVGGQYPIGEVFTESRDLDAVHGRVRVSLFGDTSFSVNRPPTPITLVVERGRVVDALDSTPEFDRVLESIRADEGEVRVRELGFGLNRAFTEDRIVSDVGAFERMCGVHLSLGGKHAIYSKPEVDKKTARQHVDVFVAADRVRIDDEVVFRDGTWTVS